MSFSSSPTTTTATPHPSTSTGTCGGVGGFKSSGILHGSTNRYTDGSGRKLDGMDLPSDLYAQKISNRAYPPKQEPWRKNQDHLMISSPQFSSTKAIGSGKKNDALAQQREEAMRRGITNMEDRPAGEVAPTYKGTVVVSGAGVVGCVAASIFALRGWHVTVVEQRSAPVAPMVRRGSEVSTEEEEAMQRMKQHGVRPSPSTTEGGETFETTANNDESEDAISPTTGQEESRHIVSKEWDNRLEITNVDPHIRGIEMTLLSKRGFDSMMAAGVSKHELKQLGVQVEGVMDHPSGFNTWLTSGLTEEHLFATNMLALDMPRLRAYLDTHLQRLPTENCRVFYSHKTVAAMSGTATREVAVQDLTSASSSTQASVPPLAGGNIYHVPYDLLINAEGSTSSLRDLLDVEGESYHTTYGVKWFALDEVKETIGMDATSSRKGGDGSPRGVPNVPWVLEQNRVHRWTYPCPHNTGNTVMIIAYPRHDSGITTSASSRSSFSVMAYMPMSILAELSDSEILEKYMSDISTERLHEFNTGARGGRGGGNKNEDFAPLVDKKLANDKAAPSSSNNGDTTTTITAVATNFELQTFVPPGVPRSRLIKPFPIVFCEELTNGNGFSTAVAVGDAAHTSHPFLQQNLNIALEDCSALMNQVDGLSRNFFDALKQYSVERGVAGDSLRVLCERSLYYNRAKHYNMLLRLRNRYSAVMHGIMPRKYNSYYEGSPNQLYGRSVEWMLNGRGYSPYERVEMNQSRHHRYFYFTRYYV